MQIEAGCYSGRFRIHILFWITPLLVATAFAQFASVPSPLTQSASHPLTEPLPLPQYQLDLLILVHGGLYPHNGGILTVRGVPFVLGTTEASHHTGALLPTTDPPPWRRRPASIEVPVGRDRVTEVYILLNSSNGRCGANIGRLDFVGADHRKISYSIVEGMNVRDHNQDRYCNTLQFSAGTAEFGHQVRLDMQRFKMSAELASGRLEKIVFHVLPGTGPDGSPFIAGITTVRIPQDKPRRGISSTTIQFDKIPDVSATFRVGQVGAAEAEKQTHNSVAAGIPKPACIEKTNARPCTPERVVFRQLSEYKYHVLLPANIGAEFSNPYGVKPVVSNAIGLVCWDRSEDIVAKQMGRATAYCNSPEGDGIPGGRGFMSPQDAAGKLVYQTRNGRTAFFVNGRVRNIFENSQGKFEFRDHDGFFEFDVDLSPRSNQNPVAKKIR